MLFSLLMSIQFIYVVAETFNAPIFQQSDQNKLEHVWHSYTFNTGAGNREELRFSSVGLDSNFKSSENVFMWRSIQIEGEIAIAGLGNNFLLVTIRTNESDSVSLKEDLEGPPVGLTLFQKWNAKAQQIKSFAVMAVQRAENNYLIKWYEIFNRSLKLVWDWPFYRTITQLDVIKVGHESKLLIVNHNNKTYTSHFADIYNFNINEGVDVWLLETIILDDIPSSVTVFETNNNVFLSASFPSLEMIHVFRYSKSLCLEELEQKHFVSQQRIYRIGLRSATSFRVGFRWYLAVASKNSYIYQVTENFLFQPTNDLNLGSVNAWLVVPLESYREDVILLADSNSDVALITWTGDENFGVVGSFTKLACENDATCLEKIKNVSLKHSTAFNFNGHQNILLSTENAKSLMFKFYIRLKPVPDDITVKLNEILKEKDNLELDFNRQNSQISRLRNTKKDPSGKGAKSVDFSAPSPKPRSLEAESHTSDWTEMLSAVDNLKAKISSLDVDIRKFQGDLKSNTSYRNEPKSVTALPRNVPEGITFYGNVLINDLNLSTMNGRDVSEILNDSYRKNKSGKLLGKKTLKKLSAENVMFEKIGDVLACDVIFSDDLCEEGDKNVINGDIVFENSLDVIDDVTLTNPAAKSYIPERKGSSLVYDTLNFDELEVAEEILFQGNINGELFILPVHNIHLNILEKVNQARIEVLNVEENLEVGLINGKNFSWILEQIILKDFHQFQNKTIKIDGTFVTHDLQVKQINDFDLEKSMEEHKNHVSEIQTELPVEYGSESKLKTAKRETLRRIVHVFQNLEIDGILLSDRINNVSWTYLQDTVKKGEKNVSLHGLKKFRGRLEAPEITLTGTVNGKFVENILTNFSDQVIRFPQIFNNVEFKNLSMRGFWNGVRVDNLDQLFCRLSSNISCDCNVTFIDECFMNELTVTERVNDLSLPNGRVETLSGEKLVLKSISSPNVVLHGSLVTNNKINEMNLTHFDMLRVSLKSPETIEQDMSHYNITVSGDLNLKTLNFNDVTDVLNSGGDTGLIEKFLNGDTHRIKKLLVKGLVQTSHGINGFNLTEVFENGVCIGKPNSVKGNITFENIVNFNDINVTGSVDGFSLKKLEKDIVLKHSQVFLNGGKNFTTVKVTKNMKARTLNGHLVQNIVTLKGDHKMQGPVQVNGDVIVTGDITSYSSINNVTVPDLLRTFSTRFNSYMYPGDLNLESEKVTVKNLILGGAVQDVSLEDVINDGVKKEESFNVSGKKSFDGKVTFRKDVFVEDSIHGLNFTDFYDDVVFINVPTKLKGTLKIEEAVLKLLEVKGDFKSRLINKVDTNDWFEESIPLDKYAVVGGKKTFENPVVLRDVSVNFINNRLPSAMILLKEKQHIPVLVFFPKINATTDITVSGSVNGKNLVQEFEDTILSYGVQTINDQVLFSNEFTINGNLYVDTIKGRKVNDLITLDTDQKIGTRLTFEGLVTAKQNVEKLKIINGVDLDEWNRNSVALNREQTLSGSWTVKGNVKAKNITGDGLLYNARLPDISKDVYDGKITALEIRNDTEAEYNAQSRKVEKLTQELFQLPYLFYQFEVAQEIETSTVIDSIITLKINNEEYLIVSHINNCFSSLFKWDRETVRYVYVRDLNMGPVSKWIVAYLNQETYVVTVSLKSSIACEENLQQSNVWIFNGNPDGYAHLPLKNRFVDIIQENCTSAEFFALDENGDLYRWIIGENLNVTSKHLLNVGQGNFKFTDFRITNGLAVSNNREIIHIKMNGDEITQSSVLFFNSQMVALPIDGKILTAVILRDKVIVYENLLEDRIFSVIHIYKAGSAVWFNYGPKRQAFLIIASHHKFIEVFEYKGVSGFVKVMSFPMFSSKLQSVILPSVKKYQMDKFLIVIQKKKLIFLRADMLGSLWQTEDSLC